MKMHINFRSPGIIFSNHSDFFLYGYLTVKENKKNSVPIKLGKEMSIGDLNLDLNLRII